MTTSPCPRVPASLDRAPNDYSDPWQAAATEGSADLPGNWLLSYLDLMTLLFTFFVMLFAYAKATASKPPAVAETQPPPALVAARAPLAVPAIHYAPPAAPTVQAAASRASDPATAPGDPSPQPAADSAAAPKPPPPAAEPGWVAAPVEPLAALSAALGKDVEISEAPGRLRLEIGDSILFAAASAELGARGAGVLDRLAGWLNTQPGAIAVEGHTDDRPIATGRYRSNWELSAARAGTVARGLIERGIPPERLRAVGLAETQPRADNLTPEGRARNRRVALVVFINRKRGLKI
jgi:chemotaxis protein MotB